MDCYNKWLPTKHYANVTQTAENLSILRGMTHHQGGAARLREQLRARLAEHATQCGFSPVEFPLVEPRAVFEHAVGDESDIVRKEMFEVRGAREESDWVLRPEGTAQVMRTRVADEQNFASERVWYWGPMFRYERPQKGRLRQFTQFGVESFGNGSVYEDIQMLLFGQQIMSWLPEGTAVLEVGSLGSDECRASFRAALVAHLQAYAAQLCPDCNRRAQTNPLRALDCKKEACVAIHVHAPSVQDHLNAEMRQRQDLTLQALADAGVDYRLNRTLVRGLDYYGGIVFEWTTDRLGAKAAVCAGGRFDKLSTLYGGPMLPAIGFALGIERFTELLGAATTSQTQLRLVVMPDAWTPQWWILARRVRESSGMTVTVECDAKSIKAHMRRANRDAVSHVAIIGTSERDSGRLTVKSMADGSAQELPVAEVAAWAAQLMRGQV